MKKFIALVFATLLTIGLTSCSEVITSGEVVDKTFKPAYSQLLFVPMTVSNGKTISTVMMPFTYNYPDTYRITIQKYDKENSEMLEATYRVTKEIYFSVELGTEFVYEDSYEPNAPEYYRERQ